MADRNRPWQFSLNALFVFVTIAAVIAKFAGWVGYPFLLCLTPIMAVFWLIDRMVSDMQQRGNHGNNPGGPDSAPPVA